MSFDALPDIGLGTMGLAEKHDATKAQIALTWLVKKGAVPIPRSQSDDHLRQNLTAMDIELTSEGVDTIESIDREKKLFASERESE